MSELQSADMVEKLKDNLLQDSIVHAGLGVKALSG